MDFYLAFPDQAAADAVLYSEEGKRNYVNIDTIGILYKPTGEVQQTEEGQIPVMAPISGWHVNVRLMPGEDAASLEPFKVLPASPVRVWG